MIDTVRYYQSRTYRYTVPLKQAIAVGGGFLAGYSVRCVGWDTYVIIHKDSGLRAIFCAGALRRVEVSLPRLLFKRNGKLLSSQRDIDASLNEADALLDLFSSALSHRRVFTRVDLVWQFKGNPVEFAAAHAHCCHPMIHQPARDFRNSGLEWQGSQTKILMYDKSLEQTGRPGNVVRVEIQLKGGKLRKVLGRGVDLTSLTFRKCYHEYRSIILRFSPKPIPLVSDAIDLIAFARQVHGIDLWQHWQRNYTSRQSLNRARRQLLLRKVDYSSIDWLKMLPLGLPCRKTETHSATALAVNVYLCH